MDTDMLFRDEEHFSVFGMQTFIDDSASLDEIDNFSTELYNWKFEPDLNHDLNLIPLQETYDLDLINGSPPKQDFQKIMNDWQKFINAGENHVDGFLVDNSCITLEESIKTSEHKIDLIDEILKSNDITSLDLPTTIFENDKCITNDRAPKAGVKKIDLQAQKYIVEEDIVNEDDNSDEEDEIIDNENKNNDNEDENNDNEDENIDVETVSECENTPVLEAGDLKSLLEQFEATELNIMNESINNNRGKIITQESIEIQDNQLIYNEAAELNIMNESININRGNINQESIEIQDNQLIYNECDNIESDSSEESNKTVKLVDYKTKYIKNEVTENQHEVPQDSSTAIVELPVKIIKQECPGPTNPPIAKSEPTTSKAPNCVRNKHIIDALPQELISRIKESGKRKAISVIPAIPNKRRGVIRQHDATPQFVPNKNVKQVSNPELIHLDHDYCSTMSPYPKYPKKDSGFESAEEDDRSIRNQPIFKNADGKLMVSLLKVNTIRKMEDTQKKKLNLEEYKKRREGVLKSKMSSSQASSPLSSACSSPLPEDDHTKRMKHEEKLKKMALELLSTPAKSGGKPDNVVETVTVPAPAVPPPDMEVKTFVSIGVNTDIVDIHGKHPLTPGEQFEQIKPLLESASIKINSNSFITSLIQNIPKIKPADKPASKEEHGEDKTIIYLPKDRVPVKTANAEVQTTVTLATENKRRYRRRRDSSTSSSSSSSSDGSSNSRKRKGSHSSKSSSSSSISRYSSRSVSNSSFSSRSSSRSRSRSISPRRPRKRDTDQEYVREVEERRVVYVGKIAGSTKREDLRRRFQKYGPIKNISLHFRDHGDNYGFVTFANKLDAYEAIEHGNDNAYEPQYDLSFGGRRLFCKTSYSDLDNMRDDPNYFAPSAKDSFDTLLKEMQDKLRKRKV